MQVIISNSHKDYSMQLQGKYLQDEAGNPVRQEVYLFSLQKDKLPFQVLFETPELQAEKRNLLVPVFLQHFIYPLSLNNITGTVLASDDLQMSFSNPC